MSTLNKTNPKIWAERRIPCFAGTGDRSPQQNYYTGKPSFVGKGLDPFRKIQRTERQKTVRYDNHPLIKTERRKTIPYAIVQHIKTERRKTVPYAIIYHIKTERCKTVPYNNRPPHQNGTSHTLLCGHRRPFPTTKLLCRQTVFRREGA